MDLTPLIIGSAGYLLYLKLNENKSEISNRKELSEHSQHLNDKYNIKDVSNLVQNKANVLAKKSLFPEESGIIPIIRNDIIEEKLIKDSDILNGPMFRKRVQEKQTGFTPIKEAFSETGIAGTAINNKTHNNMKPFFGGRVKQNVDVNIDIVGRQTGNEVNYQKKIESVPTFKPTKTNIYGNHFDLNKDRYIQNNLKTGIVPVEQIRVRHFDETALRPTFKTIDELQVNPQQTKEARMNYGKSLTTSRGIVPENKKFRPETAFKQNVTDSILTGEVSRQSIRENFVNGTSSISESIKYLGNAKKVNVRSSNRTEIYKDDDKIALPSFGIRNAGKSSNNKVDYGLRDRIAVIEQERDTTNSARIAIATNLGKGVRNHNIEKPLLTTKDNNLSSGRLGQANFINKKPTVVLNNFKKKSVRSEVSNRIPGASRNLMIDNTVNMESKDSLENTSDFTFDIKEKTNVFKGKESINSTLRENNENVVNYGNSKIINNVTPSNLLVGKTTRFANEYDSSDRTFLK